MKTAKFHPLEALVDAFLFDRKVQNFTPGTVTYYRGKLKRFRMYCHQVGIEHVEQITPDTLRGFLAQLESDGLVPGGRLGHYRAVKTFLRWFACESAPEAWSNPIEKVKPPKVPDAPIQPISLKDAERVLSKCPADLKGTRDKAIFLLLIDTGIRATELLSLNTEDVDFVTGSALIRAGKGGKTRTVYFGSRTKKSLRRYISMRDDDADPLFVSLDDRARLTYPGLRWIVLNRFRDARVRPRGIHTFRRLHALTMLRNGVDVITLSRLMGHSTTEVLRRYLAQTDEDLHIAHARASPVDNGLL